MKPKIIHEQPSAGADEIQARRDFQSVLKRYHVHAPTASHKSWLKWGAGFVATAGLIAMYAVLGNKQPETTTTLPPQVQIEKVDQELHPMLQPRLPEHCLPFATYRINAARGGKFTHSTGTHVEVPAMSLVDSTGKSVTGDVEIRYREFHNPAEFFASGIPMTYDTLGEIHHFESAGMVEIRAFQNGQQVYLAPDKGIHVELTSEYDGTQYNLYTLNEPDNTWKPIGKDKVIHVDNSNTPGASGSSGGEVYASVSLVQEEIRQTEQSLQSCQARLADLKKTNPVQPKKVTPGAFKFNIDVNLSSFPEMEAFSTTVFQVSQENIHFNPEEAQLVWQSVELKPTSKSGLYKVVFQRPDKRMEVLAEPVVSEKDYPFAIKRYDEAVRVFSDKLEARLKEEEALKKQLVAKSEALAKAFEAERKKREETLQQGIALGGEVKRIFTVNDFGIYNCDNPTHLPKGNTLQASFVDENGNKMLLAEVCLVDKKRNAIFPFSGSQQNELSYNPSSKNLLWAVTRDGKIAYFDSEDFTKVPNKKQAYTFKMKIMEGSEMHSLLAMLED
ncbi:MAG: hypothetical protein H6585_14435 [Flavobacteriales bacterium]|nr:hypothetical protein [Flavobacteriales bacterium]MCB9449527.1 hypothetical protein [Flavobacteriales bacterium]